MKMNKELFDKLADAIDGVMSSHSLQVITKKRETIDYVKSQFISFCWFMFHACKIDYHMFYDAGLNDDNIETALKRILLDFK